MNEEDKRVIRTRTQLTQALIELSCEEGYEAVTVQEIADRAGINYRTFYRHYDSKEDLVRDVLSKTLAGLHEKMPPPTPEELNNSEFEKIARHKGRMLYEYVAANRDIFRLLLQSGPLGLVPVQEIARSQTEFYFSDLPLGNVPHELVANHIIMSGFSFIQWWLDNDMPYTPEEMGAFTAQLIMLPIRRLLVNNM